MNQEQCLSTFIKKNITKGLLKKDNIISVFNATLARFSALVDQNSPEGQKLRASLNRQREKIDESGAYSWEGASRFITKL